MLLCIDLGGGPGIDIVCSFESGLGVDPKLKVGTACACAAAPVCGTADQKVEKQHYYFTSILVVVFQISHIY